MRGCTRAPHLPLLKRKSRTRFSKIGTAVGPRILGVMSVSVGLSTNSTQSQPCAMENSTALQPLVDDHVDYTEDGVGASPLAAVVPGNSAVASNYVSAVPVESSSDSSDGAVLNAQGACAAERRAPADKTMVPALTRGQRQAQGEPEPLQRLEHTGRTPVAVRAVSNDSTATVDVRPIQPSGREGGEINEMVDDDSVARATAVVLATHEGREFPTFPAPSTFDDVDCYAQDDVTLRTIGRAPWFDRNVVFHPNNQLDRYDDGHGFLPGLIHVGSVDSYCWRFQFSARDRDIAQSSGTLPSTQRNDFVAACYDGLSRLKCIQPVPEDIDCDMFVMRFEGDAEYLRALNRIPEATLTGWSGVKDVRQEALCYQGPLLPLEFRYNTKGYRYWLSWCAEERYFRARYGQVIPYHCPQAMYLNHESRRRSYVRLNATWERYEVPQGANVRTPRVFTYKPSQLLARDSPWFVVAYTEQVAETAVWLLMEVYDSLRLWWVSSHTISAIRALDLRVVLGSQANIDELESLLAVIETTRFEDEPVAQSMRYREVAGNCCLGRSGAGGDFVYYDPFAERKLSPAEYRQRMVRERPQLPPGHPTGYDYDTEVAGWDGRRYTPTNHGGVEPAVCAKSLVPYLVPEMQVSATRYADFILYEHDEDSRGAGKKKAVAAPVAKEVALKTAGDAGEEAEVVRRFLAEAGVEADLHDANWAGLVMFLRGRLSR